MALAIGVAFAGTGGYLVYDQNRAVNGAETVEATVVDADVRQVDSSEGGVNYLNSGANAPSSRSNVGSDATE